MACYGDWGLQFPDTPILWCRELEPCVCVKPDPGRFPTRPVRAEWTWKLASDWRNWGIIFNPQKALIINTVKMENSAKPFLSPNSLVLFVASSSPLSAALSDHGSVYHLKCHTDGIIQHIPFWVCPLGWITIFWDSGVLVSLLNH